MQHGGEGVVELVGDTRRHPADGGEPLVLEGLALGALKLLVRGAEIGLVGAHPDRHAIEGVRQGGHLVAAGEA